MARVYTYKYEEPNFTRAQRLAIASEFRVARRALQQGKADWICGALRFRRGCSPATTHHARGIIVDRMTHGYRVEYAPAFVTTWLRDHDPDLYAQLSRTLNGFTKYRIAWLDALIKEFES